MARRVSRLNIEGAAPASAMTQHSPARRAHPRCQQIKCRGLFADAPLCRFRGACESGSGSRPGGRKCEQPPTLRTSHLETSEGASLSLRIVQDRRRDSGSSATRDTHAWAPRMQHCSCRDSEGIQNCYAVAQGPGPGSGPGTRPGGGMPKLLECLALVAFLNGFLASCSSFLAVPRGLPKRAPHQRS